MSVHGLCSRQGEIAQVKEFSIYYRQYQTALLAVHEKCSFTKSRLFTFTSVNYQRLSKIKKYQEVSPNPPPLHRYSPLTDSQEPIYSLMKIFKTVRDSPSESY